MPVGLLLACAFLVVAGNLAGNRVADPTPFWAALPGWEQGSVLRVLMVAAAGWLTPFMPAATALVLLHILVASAAAALLCGALCRSDWPPLLAAAAVVLLGTSGPVIFAITFSRPELLVALAAGFVVPARRQLEASGDVQSVISFGLMLPMLVLAGPSTALLVPFLLLAAPLRDAQARIDFRVFLTLMLVALVPTLIVMAGASVTLMHSGATFGDMVAPFVDAFRLGDLGPDDSKPQLLAVAMVAVVVVVHLLVPDRRRQVRSSVLALALPIYLMAGNAIFSWYQLPLTAPLALLATSAGWLATTRIRPWTRWLTLALLLGGNVAGWLLLRDWATPDWADGLLPLRFFNWAG